MALHNPFSFPPALSPTPSPDRPAFAATPSDSPEVLQTFAREIYGLMSSKLHEKTSSPLHQPPSLAAATDPVLPKSPSYPPSHLLNDPKYLAMASRIAAYYQHRSQAVANYQHQKCKEWADLQQQKTKEMTQVTMLVVAWYVRDRITRRRRRQKKLFNRGLSRTAATSKVNKSESVRRWAMNIPAEIESPTSPVGEKFADGAEADFDMDREAPPDRDTELFRAADHFIKGQLARVNVPLFGALTFDESEDEDKDDEEFFAYDEEDTDGEIEDDSEFSEDDTPEDDSGGIDRQQAVKEEPHSDEVLVGSGKASRENRCSAV